MCTCDDCICYPTAVNAFIIDALLIPCLSQAYALHSSSSRQCFAEKDFSRVNREYPTCLDFAIQECAKVSIIATEVNTTVAAKRFSSPDTRLKFLSDH